MFNTFTARVDKIIKHRNTEEEVQNAGLKDFIVFSCLNKRQISGPTSLHDVEVNIAPFTANFDPDYEQMEGERFTINEAAEFEG